MTRPYRWTEEGLAKRRAAVAALWADPVFRTKIADRAREAHQRNAWHATLSDDERRLFHRRRVKLGSSIAARAEIEQLRAHRRAA